MQENQLFFVDMELNLERQQLSLISIMAEP
jgi:hypothetical protein